MKKRKWLKRILWSLIIVFILMNAVAYMHAYRFTHFDPDLKEKTGDPKELSFGEKLSTLFFGIRNPRPVNNGLPSRPYQTLKLQSHKKIECWLIPVDSAKGTVALFHGYGGSKSGMLDRAEAFAQMGYTTLLVDFMGSGGSEGNQTTLGFHEAKEVQTVFDHLKTTGHQKLVLFGTSMGAVAIMKALHDHSLKPHAVILECPFGTMSETVKARFRTMGVLSFPMAQLLMFWGGVQNGFNAFGHNPDRYATKIDCPTLLMIGEKDEKVSMEETKRIFESLKGPKQLETFPLAGHENYLNTYKFEWIKDVNTFLNGIS